ncbi:MAG: ankyrin repeat domain-containing protein [Alphaproteobacteria bacterium]
MTLKNETDKAFAPPTREPSVADIQLFFEAVQSEDAIAINPYLVLFPSLLEHRDRDRGATPLIVAARSGNLAGVEFLHGKGADLKATDNADMDALMNACEKGEMPVAKYLVETAGMDPGRTTSGGMTPATIACGAEFPSMQSRMLRYVEEQKEARLQALHDEIDGMEEGTQRPLSVSKPLQLRLKF